MLRSLGLTRLDEFEAFELHDKHGCVDRLYWVKKGLLTSFWRWQSFDDMKQALRAHADYLSTCLSHNQEITVDHSWHDQRNTEGSRRKLCITLNVTA